MRPTTPIHMGILNNNFDLVQEMVVNRFTTWHSIKVHYAKNHSLGNPSAMVLLTDAWEPDPRKTVGETVGQIEGWGEDDEDELERLDVQILVGMAAAEHRKEWGL